MALPRAGAAEPAIPSPPRSSTSVSAAAAAPRTAVALRTLAEGVERDETRAERGEPRRGSAHRGSRAGRRRSRRARILRREARRAAPAVPRRCAPAAADRPSLGPVPAPPREAEIGAVRIGRRRLEATLADIGADLGDHRKSSDGDVAQAGQERICDARRNPSSAPRCRSSPWRAACARSHRCRSVSDPPPLRSTAVELPGEIVGVAHARAHALPHELRRHMRRVAGEQHAPSRQRSATSALKV